MDAILTAAARALDAGDVLEALKRVALRNDAPALALRGVALARLGKFERARDLLHEAARAFGTRAPGQRARCLLADAEIALASRDLRGLDAALAMANRTLSAQGDVVNAAHATCLAARNLLLRGRLDEAEIALTSLADQRRPATLETAVQLTWADLHLRKLNSRAAKRAIEQAGRAAKRAGIASLSSEFEAMRARLVEPIARAIRNGIQQELGTAELEALLQKKRFLVVDARELVLRTTQIRVPLKRRPILFALARALADAWPAAATRGELILRAFAVTRVNESHRARLRVELTRLRRALRAVATITATPQGFQLSTLGASEVVVLARLADDDHANLLALLSDGEAWSSSALALALGVSQRSVQRALLALEQAGKVRAIGRARAQRWLPAPSAGFAPSLLLPSALQLA